MKGGFDKKSFAAQVPVVEQKPTVPPVAPVRTTPTPAVKPKPSTASPPTRSVETAVAATPPATETIAKPVDIEPKQAVVEVATVSSGGHYSSMIKDGIPAAIKFIQ